VIVPANPCTEEAVTLKEEEPHEVKLTESGVVVTVKSCTWYEGHCEATEVVEVTEAPALS